jgi:YHS domain-containing protein
MGNMARDPVCGMEIDGAAAAPSSEYNGQTYYFCCQGRKLAFDKHPEKYLAHQSSGHEGMHSHTV